MVEKNTPAETPNTSPSSPSIDPVNDPDPSRMSLCPLLDPTRVTETNGCAQPRERHD